MLTRLYLDLIIFLIAVMIGFFWGKNVGMKEGLRVGIALTPLLLRKKSLEEGRCLLCTNGENNKYCKNDLY